MKHFFRKTLILMLTIIFIVSTGIVIYQLADQRQAQEIYSEAETLVNLPDLTSIDTVASETIREAVPGVPSAEEPLTTEPMYVDPYADELSRMDFSALREINSDVFGWILIPNTKVSYPLVQGTDNDYYLAHTWRQTKSDVGSIFMEQHCSKDLSDFNTIIYGHRMKNGSMFGSLKNYSNSTYLKQHPVIYITDENGVHAYEIFSVYEANVSDLTYRIGSFSDAEKREYINWCLAQSIVDCGVIPTVSDRIITLSTCTGRGYETRWVVQGVMRTVHSAEIP